MDDEQQISVDIDWFASRPHWFPWQELGLDRPKWGPAHSYACTILAALSQNEPERQFLVQRPSIRELARFVACFDANDRHWPAFASKILETFRPTDASGNENHRRPLGSTEYQLIRFLTGLTEFRRWAEQRLTLLWRDGRFKAPQGALETRRKGGFNGGDW